MGVLTVISALRRGAPLWWPLGQTASTVGLVLFVLGHWNHPVRYALDRWWLLAFIVVFGWELFYLGTRLVRILPQASSVEGMAARAEILWLSGRALFLIPAVVSGAAFAYRIWF